MLRDATASRTVARHVGIAAVAALDRVVTIKTEHSVGFVFRSCSKILHFVRQNCNDIVIRIVPVLYEYYYLILGGHSYYYLIIILL